jgi:hypothetical protein
MVETPEAIAAEIRGEHARPVGSAVLELAGRITSRYGEALQAILFYGSCLRSGEDRGGLVDLYVIVDTYRGAYTSRTWALLNALLPPNVFYLEVPFEGRVVRAKYAILSLADLKKATSSAWFHSYFWGRFTQPTALIYSRSAAVAGEVQAALATAVMTFLTRVVPCLPPRFSVEDLWMQGLKMSYRAELRAERPEKLAALYRTYADRYARLTEAALPALPFPVERVEGQGGLMAARISALRRASCRWGWRVRSVQGKVLSVLRLLKGAFSFTGGLDYILWKIERHSGVTVEIAPRLRRHPIIAVGVVSWRLYRKGAFR